MHRVLILSLLLASAPTDVIITGGTYPLHGEILVPDGPGPFPAIVYNHGSERDPSLDWMGDTARWFQAHGFIALFPYRRGTHGSGGPYWQDEVKKRPEEEQTLATVQALEVEAEDVMAAIKWLAQRRDVDAKRIVVSGCSFGGIVTLLAAEHGDHLRAAVDFAGGSMSWSGNAELRERMKRAAHGAKVPVFFLQAENDFNTTPTRVLSAERSTHTGKVFPPHGTTPMQGHAHFCNRAQAEWGPDVLAFLEKTGVLKKK